MNRRYYVQFDSFPTKFNKWQIRFGIPLAEREENWMDRFEWNTGYLVAETHEVSFADRIVKALNAQGTDHR